MASRFILNNVKLPIQFLLQTRASSVPSEATASLVQSINNLRGSRQNPLSNAGDLFKNGVLGCECEICLHGRPFSYDLKFALDGRYRIKASNSRGSIDDLADDFDDGDDSDSDGFRDSRSDDDFSDSERE